MLLLVTEWPAQLSGPVANLDQVCVEGMIEEPQLVGIKLNQKWQSSSHLLLQTLSMADSHPD